jgi:hypothetical protein
MPRSRVLLAALFLASCSPAAPAPAQTPPPPQSPKPAPLSLILPVTGIDGGTTKVGPRLPDGSWLVLVSGRRALVAPDGSVREERAHTAEPLFDLLEIPTAAGPRLVGVSEHEVHRFTDPLGRPTATFPLPEGVDRAAPGPGYVVTWVKFHGDQSQAVDVETGAQTSVAWPLTRGLAFRSLDEGAVLTWASGLEVTDDGGRTFRHVEIAGEFGAQDVEVADGELRAWRGKQWSDRQPGDWHNQGLTATVDVSHASVGPFADPSRHTTAPALVRWIEQNEEPADDSAYLSHDKSRQGQGIDPRAVAVHVGLPLRPGEALAAQRGLLARVDLATGSITEWALYPFDPQPGTPFANNEPCRATRVGSRVWLGCPASGDFIGKGVRGFGVHLLDVEGDHLKMPRLVLTAAHDGAIFRRSAAGGALLTSPCRSQDHGDACVLQPDGSWKTLAAAATGDEHAEQLDNGMWGFVPLVDGGMAYAIASRPERDEKGAPRPGLGLGHPALQHRIAVVDATGRRRFLPPLPPSPEMTESELAMGEDLVMAAMEQRADGAILIHLRTAGAPVRHFAAVQPLEGPAAPPRLIQGHVEDGVALGLGRVVAAASDHGSALLSTDAGEHWMSLGVSANVNWVKSVSDVGMDLGSLIILGDPQSSDCLAHGSEGRAGCARPALPKRTEPVMPPEPSLRCTAGAPIPVPAMALPRAVEKRGDEKPSAAQGLDVAWPSRGRVELIQEPASWTLRWLDEGELGARVRTFRGPPPAPPPAPAEVTLRAAAVRGEDVYVVLAGKSGADVAFVGHVTPRSARWNRISKDTAYVETLSPPGSAGAPLAWLASGRVWLWSDGEEPRAVAQYDRSSPPDKLPFTFRATDKATLAVALDGWSTVIATQSMGSPLPWLPVAGWAHRDGGLHGMELCTAPGPGVFVPERSRSTVEVSRGDGSVAKFERGQFRIRVNGQAECIEGFHSEESTYSTDGGKTWLNSARGESRLVVDFARKRGELAMTPGKGKPFACAVTCSIDGLK